MQLPAQAHVAIADAERFVLMRNAGPAAEARLELVGEPGLDGEDASGAGGHHDPRSDDCRTWDKLGHGAGIAGWLNGRVLDHRIEQLLIVADPDTLGELGRRVTAMPGPDILRVIEAA